MIREYESGTDGMAEFFIGTEIEHTKFLGQKTLFVVDAQPTRKVLEILNQNPDVAHVYIGANHSITSQDSFDAHYSLLEGLLALSNKNLTIDTKPEYFSNTKLNLITNDRICYTLSLRVPHIERVGGVHVKIDDIDFNATNSGVWVYPLDNSKRTSWDKYSKDVIL